MLIAELASLVDVCEVMMFKMSFLDYLLHTVNNCLGNQTRYIFISCELG